MRLLPRKPGDETLLEKSVDSKRIYEGKIINVRCDNVLLPNGKTSSREVVEHPGAVAVVPITGDGKIVLVRQYRYSVGQILLEIPAGKLNKGENPDECAKRELAEETGFEAEKIKRLSSIYTGPGFTNEIIHIYLADEITAFKQHPDEDEFLNVEIYSKEEINAMVKSGFICDAKTIAGLALSKILD